MNHFVGLHEFDLTHKRLNTPIYYNPATLINAHVLFVGMSGSGKSHCAGGFLTSAINAGGIELDVFDAHDEYSDLPGASSCIFSQATGYGYNPLVLNPDPHTGGVNSQINFIIRLVKQVTPQFGIKQEGVLRNLLLDTYASFGITQEDPRSWHRHEINEVKRAELIDKEDFETLHQCYPTMEDLKALAKEKMQALTIGSDQPCVTAFDALCRMRKRLEKLQRDRERAYSEEEICKLDDQIKKQNVKCIETYTAFIETISTGREIEDVLRYDSSDVIIGVVQRLVLLGSTGILSANRPPFGNSHVRVHQIKSLDHDQQVLYVKLRLLNIFDECKRQGMVAPGSPPRRICYLEEGHKYFTPEESDIINIISKEARKFGLGLWCSSQQPTSFPESFLTNTGCAVLLGLHTSYWKRAASMFRITEKDLLKVKPKEIMAIKCLVEGKVDPPFTSVVVPNPNNPMGRRAIEAKP